MCTTEIFYICPKELCSCTNSNTFHIDTMSMDLKQIQIHTTIYVSHLFNSNKHFALYCTVCAWISP